MDRADLLMRRAVAEGVFPGGAVWVMQDGAEKFSGAYGKANIYTGRPVRVHTVFDLASLTKPLATALAVLLLAQDGRVDFDQCLADLLPGFGERKKGAVTLRQLLSHTAGLPAYRPYYIEVYREAQSERRQALNRLLAAEPLESSPGAETVYSDLCFMLLRWVVEETSGERLDRFVTRRIYHPLGLDDLFFAGDGERRQETVFAATEMCPWRGFLVDGLVHDHNAYALGGIDGQAGLFGTAASVGALLTELTAVYHRGRHAGLFDPERIRELLRPVAPGRRTLGFDVPAPEGSSSGCRFSRQTVGHLGFTGTSFWMDLEKKAAVVLLTNRIHPRSDNQGIKTFRPQLHDAVMDGLFQPRQGGGRR